MDLSERITLSRQSSPVRKYLKYLAQKLNDIKRLMDELHIVKWLRRENASTTFNIHMASHVSHYSERPSVIF